MLKQILLVFLGALLAIVAQLVLTAPDTTVSFDPSLPASQLPPWPIWKVIHALTDAAIGFTQAAPAWTRALGLIGAFWDSAIMYSFAMLHVGSRVHARPLTCAELTAALTAADAEGRVAQQEFVCRLAESYVAAGLLEKDAASGAYSNTELGDLMRLENPKTFNGLSKVLHDPVAVSAFFHLHDQAFTGDSGFKHETGMEVWDYFASRGFLEPFGTGMTALTSETMPALLADYDMDGAKVFCDVGGGQGTAVGVVLQHYPEMRGVVFDMPLMSSVAEAYLASQGVGDRSSFVGGNFFEPFPAEMEQCDIFFLRNIMHDWPQEECAAILGVIAETMRKQDRPTRVLINDLVIGASDIGHLETMKHKMDINMMATCPGGARERRLEHFLELFDATGLELSKAHLLRDMASVTEAVLKQ